MKSIELALSAQIKRSFEKNDATGTIKDRLFIFGGTSPKIEYYCFITNTWKVWWDCSKTANVKSKFFSVVNSMVYIWDHREKKVSMTDGIVMHVSHEYLYKYLLLFENRYT